MVDFVGRTHGGEYAGHLPCRQAFTRAQHPSCCRVCELSLGSTRLLSSHYKISLQPIAVFCMHTLDVHSLTRQVSQLTGTDHTLHGAGML